MSLYGHTGLRLLPKPPRSLFSLGPEETRALLPKVEDVVQLQTFLYRLFVYDLRFVPSLKTQIIFAAVCVAILMVVVGCITARRMYEQSFWIVRIVERPTGNVLVPNSVLCFAIVEGVFCAVIMALMWCIIKTFYTKSIPPSLNPAWLLLPWCPMISGKFWAAWGMYLALPTHLSNKVPKRSVGRMRACVARPNSAKVTNYFGIGFPFIISTTIIVPTIVAMGQWSKAYRSFVVWQAAYSTQTAFTEPMLHDAQKVWFQVLTSMYTVTVTFIVWAFWSLVVFAMYCWSSYRLMSGIRQEMRLMNELAAPRQGIAVVTRREAAFPNKWQMEAVPMADEPTVLCTILEASAVTAATSEQERAEFTCSTTLADTVESDVLRACRPPWQRLLSSRRKKSFSFLKPHVVIGKHDLHVNRLSGQSRQDQASQLNKAVFQVSVQISAIAPTSLLFFVIAILMAILTYGSTEQPFDGGTYFEPVIAVAIVIAIWTVIFFGSTTFMAILLRTYEYVLASVYYNAHSYATVLRENRRSLFGERLHLATAKRMAKPRPTFGDRHHNPFELLQRHFGKRTQHSNVLPTEPPFSGPQPHIPLKVYMQHVTQSSASSPSLLFCDEFKPFDQLASAVTDDVDVKRMTFSGSLGNTAAQPHLPSKMHTGKRDGSMSSYWANRAC
jgi:hypothetical protein